MKDPEPDDGRRARLFRAWRGIVLRISPAPKALAPGTESQCLPGSGLCPSDTETA
jgi:hypothetical protein